MKCQNCKKEIEDNSKLCKLCEEKIEKIEKTTKEDKIEKKNKINIDEDVKNVKAHKDLSSKLLEMWKKLNLFEKIILPIGIVIIFSLLAALIANKNDAVIIAIIQLIGIVVTILIERNIIKTDKNWIKYVILVICFLMIGSYISFFKVHNSKSAESIIFSELVLGDMIPEIKNHKGKINLNSDERLDIDVFNVSSKEFYSYIDSCKNKGYTIDEIKQEYSFEAYTESGYKIKIYYSNYLKELDIDLSKPEMFEGFEWLTNDFAKLLPTPKSNLGKIIENSKKVYKVKISNMTIDDFNEYISKCKEKGFSIDSNKTDKRFTAKNEQNNNLEIEYIGNNIITIRIAEPIYNVQLKVDFVENWIFSKYDVKLYVNDSYESELSHGENKEFSLKLNKGKHRIKFVNSKDDNVKGYIDLEIDKNQIVELKINCYSSYIYIQNNSKSSEKTTEEKKDDNIVKEQSINTTMNQIQNQQNNEKISESYNFYTTNSDEKAKDGKSGKYAYVKKGKNYDIYWIIDFEKGYVYNFNEGDGNTQYEKIKIKSGNLNDGLKLAYKDSSNEWAKNLHFKYKNQPHILIIIDDDGLDYDFKTTSLKNALKLMEDKIEYQP